MPLDRGTYLSPRWSQEIADCSMPMTFDQYSACSYRCLYCFAFFRKALGNAAASYLGEKVRAVSVPQVKRLYTHHKLQAFPDWRKVYHGPFPMERGAAEHLAARAQFVVDMSLIAGDGGGTQYTALEAWAAGAALVMATGWGEGELRPGVNMLAVDGPVELADLLLGVEGPEQVAEVIAGGTEALQRHLTPAIGAGWARLCGVWP